MTSFRGRIRSGGYSGESEEEKMTWEYMSCRVEIDPHLTISAEMNELGKAGWELVEVVHIQTVQYRAFFKRPLKTSN
jgi:hypothetical protein